MKIKLTLLAFLALVVFFANAQPLSAQTPPKSTSRVNVKYDKGKDTTTISLKSFAITRPEQEKAMASNLPLHQMDLEGNFVYTGAIGNAEIKEVVLRFHAVAGTYIFLKPQELLVAIDRDSPEKGRGFSLGMTGYKSLAPKFNSVYEEFFEIKVPTDALRKFAAAQTLEFFFGPVAYRLGQKQLDAVKEWANFLPRDSVN